MLGGARYAVTVLGNMGNAKCGKFAYCVVLCAYVTLMTLRLVSLFKNPCARPSMTKRTGNRLRAQPQALFVLQQAI
eukprot:1790039-Amphidinium_carterae.1